MLTGTVPALSRFLAGDLKKSHGDTGDVDRHETFEIMAAWMAVVIISRLSAIATHPHA